MSKFLVRKTFTILTTMLLSVSALSASPLGLASGLKDGTYRTAEAEQAYLTTACYEISGVRYSDKVVDESLQYMNIWIPAGYVNDDGTFNWDSEINGYTAATAPIIFRNNCSGWMSSNPENDTENKIGLESYMANGFIYVACGARSRDANNNDLVNHLNWGKAPAPIVDLKAGVRFLKANSGAIPGDTEKIISVGGSGAGQMSALLGASGDLEAYYPFLYEMGAAGIDFVDGEYVSTISDSIFGTMVYYPITDLDNSDMAYAWVRLGAGDTSLKMNWPSPIDIQFSPFQYALQEDLAEAFINYVNGMELIDENGNELTLSSAREGSYYEAILENLSNAINAYLVTMDDVARNEYISSLLETGDWITIDQNGIVSINDIDGFNRNAGTGTLETVGKQFTRNKNIPGFDSFSKDAENNAFGYQSDVSVHFSASLASVLRDNLDKYEGMMTEQEKKDVELFLADFEGERAEYISKQVYLMNPSTILKNEQPNVSGHWRIRSGTADQHASLFAVSYNVGLLAAKHGAEVDYALVWAMPHFNEREGESTGTFVEWVNSICK